MNIEDYVDNAQRYIDRLAMQSEQEKAMADVLPVRFSKNLVAFKKYMPALYEQFVSYKPQKPFRFFCNENGEPNVLWLNEQASLYGDAPFLEAKEQVDDVIKNGIIKCIDFVPQWHFEGQIHIKYNNEISKLKNKSSLEGLSLSKVINMDIPLSIMYGVGLGYQLGYLYERCRIRNLFAFEPDVDMFYASLFCFDWFSLLDYLEQESMSLHLFIGMDEQLLVSDMMEALHRKGAFWSAGYFSFCHYHSDLIHSLLYKVEQNFYLLRTGWGFFDDNIIALAHSYQHFKDGTPFLIRQRNTNRFSKCPVFVVGNGPSLDNDIEFIRQHSHRAIVVACGTAISALYKAGISADICVAVERTKSSADFLKILNADDYLKNAVFLSVDVIHAECKGYFRRTGLAFKPNEPMYKLLVKNMQESFDFESIDYSNPFVGNTGLNYAALLGFEEIYLFGIDNGYKDEEKHHSTFSLYYNDKKETKIKNHTQGTFPLKANFGGVTHSNNLFGLSVHNMSSLLNAFKKIHCVNCSDGSYIDGASPVHSYDLLLSGPELDKSGIIDEILDSYFKPVDLSAVDLELALNVPFFVKFIEILRSEWRDVPIQYDAILALMQKHHDYLLYIFMTKDSHIYRVIIGSVNYFYANIISLMLSLVDAGHLMFSDKVSSAVTILDGFFVDAMKIYSNVLERQDMSDYHGLSVFKHD